MSCLVFLIAKKRLVIAQDRRPERKGNVMRRAAMALGWVVAVSSATLVAQNEPRKLTDEQKREIQAVVKIVDDAAAGKPAPNDLALAWTRHDVLKGPANRQYIPFSVTVDPSKIASDSLTVYWRVVSKTPAQPPAAPAGGQNTAKPAPAPAPLYAYEDLNTASVAAKNRPLQISRAFLVEPGVYDVHVVVKEPTSNRRNAPAPKVAFLTQSVDVQNFWNEELNTSSVIVAQRIEPLAAPLTPEQQAERPYAIGALEIFPEADLVFTKAEKLATFLLVYNARSDAQTGPNVMVEFNFYTKEGTGEKYFNKTAPEEFNAKTLPPGFDVSAGIPTGQDVPLASFPEGNYRLEIKITDRVANKSISRDVNFTVSGS
jgi:hypothetical protein